MLLCCHMRPSLALNEFFERKNCVMVALVQSETMANSKKDEEDDLYYFESDHVALKGNEDYSKVLKTLAILLAQRKRAIQDYNTAVQLKKEALADPLAVLEKITKGESLGMPETFQIAEIPVIDWSKYSVQPSEEELRAIYSDDRDTVKRKRESPKKDLKPSSGRWTAEEQKRLEELLQVYPPEPIEMRRFKKIASALGNRNVQQVTSRVQKYFLKLYKAGLPIPGRIPKSADKHRKSGLHKHQRHNHFLWKPSTFFPDLNLPISANDLEDAPGPSSHYPPDAEQPSTSNYLMPPVSQEETEPSPNKSDSELLLDLLKRVKEEKIREEDTPSLYRHLGYKCDYCSEEPIAGTRWHCATCYTASIDFCTDCIFSQYYIASNYCPHPLTHNLVTYTSEASPLDFSDSGSNAGSAVGSSNNNNESSDSSDSDFNEDGEGSEASAVIRDQAVSNGTAEDRLKTDRLQERNDDGSAKFEMDELHDNAEFYSADLEAELFTEFNDMLLDNEEILQ